MGQAQEHDKAAAGISLGQNRLSQNGYGDRVCVFFFFFILVDIKNLSWADKSVIEKCHGRPT